MTLYTQHHELSAVTSRPATRRRRSVAAAAAAAVIPLAAVALPARAATPEPTPATAAAPAPATTGQAIPGNIPGWSQVFVDDFTVDQPLGTWPGAYASRWDGYDCPASTQGCDTAKIGAYDRKRVVSAHGGLLDYYLHTEAGLPRVAAEAPRLVQGSPWTGYVYGLYSVRWRVDPGLTGHHNAWLLWPDGTGDNPRGDWDDGEVNNPEGELDSTVAAYNHCPGHPQDTCGSFKTDTRFDDPGWHTSTTQWTADGLRFYLDGRQMGQTSAANAPSTPMHWVLQTEASSARGTAGHVQVDWVAAYRPSGDTSTGTAAQSVGTTDPVTTASSPAMPSSTPTPAPTLSGPATATTPASPTPIASTSPDTAPTTPGTTSATPAAPGGTTCRQGFWWWRFHPSTSPAPSATTPDPTSTASPAGEGWASTSPTTTETPTPDPTPADDTTSAATSNSPTAAASPTDQLTPRPSASSTPLEPPTTSPSSPEPSPATEAAPPPAASPIAGPSTPPAASTDICPPRFWWWRYHRPSPSTPPITPLGPAPAAAPPSDRQSLDAASDASNHQVAVPVTF